MEVSHTFNLTITSKTLGNHTFEGELYEKYAPKAVENFKYLCTGEKGMSKNGYKLSYKGTKVTKITTNTLIEMGDITNGKGRESIYGGTFDDEDYLLTTMPGSLVMSRDGNDSNGSEFGIVMSTFPELDGIYNVFGVVKGGLMGIYKFNKIPTNEESIPIEEITITQCQIIKETRKSEVY